MSFRARIRSAVGGGKGFSGADAIPNAFLFADQTGVATNTVITSAPITVSGINSPAVISITGGTYAINGGSYTSASGTVVSGDTVTIRVTSSASDGVGVSATLTIGGVSDTFTATTASATDTVPNAFTFGDLTNVDVNMPTTSGSVQITGITGAAAISVSGGTYSVNGGNFTSSPGTVVNNDVVRVKVTSSGSFSTAVNCTLTVGGVSDTFTVTTHNGSVVHFDLVMSNLSLVGYKKFDYSGLPDGALRFAHQHACMRRVGAGDNDINFFLYTRYGGIVEHAYGSGAPASTIAGAVTMNVVRNWGEPFGATVWLTDEENGVPIPNHTQHGQQFDGGLWWDSTRNVLWGSYGDSYVAKDDHPGLHACKLNPDGTYVSYGPFKLSGGANHNRGGFVVIPEDFASAYLGGKYLGGYGIMNSGTAGMTQGLGLLAWEPPDPATLTVNENDINGPAQITQQVVMMNDQSNPRPVTTSVKTCGWNVLYDCRSGYNTGTANGKWTVQDGDSALSENNSVRCAVWVKYTRPNGNVVEGLVYFGMMADTPPGYSAPGDPQGISHIGYGNAFHPNDPPDGSGSHVAGFVAKRCCHGQDDDRWQTTGPFAHYRDRKVWIEPRSKMVSLATGAINPYNSYPAAVEAARMADIHPNFSPPMVFDMLGANASFDPQTGRIFLTQYGDPMTYLVVLQVS